MQQLAGENFSTYVNQKLALKERIIKEVHPQQWDWLHYAIQKAGKQMFWSTSPKTSFSFIVPSNIFYSPI